MADLDPLSLLRGAAAAHGPAAAEAAPAPAGAAEAGSAAQPDLLGTTDGTAKPGRKRRSADLSKGHRARLRARFDRGETLADYELLELLLFLSNAQKDTKPIAKALLDTFKTVGAVLGAPAHALEAVEGVGPRTVSDFRLIRAVATRFSTDAVQKRTVLTSTDAVADYFRPMLAYADREEFHMLFLDKRNAFLASECAGVGTVDHTPVYPREVVARALFHGASALVLVHNHPTGDPSPSKADIEMTRVIAHATEAIGIKVYDHLILAGDTYLSLKTEGFF
ncbi:MAG: DNA repair protein RadC [Pseudomonadota bacterium]